MIKSKTIVIKYILIFFILTISTLFFSLAEDQKNRLKNQVNTAFYHWNEDMLLNLVNDLISIKDKKFDELFYLTKIYFQLAFLELEKNQGNFTKRFRNDDEDEDKGFINLSIYYGEKAYRFSQKNTELNYYLIKGFQSLIHDVDTFFKYKDKIDIYRKQNLIVDPDSFYTLLYEADFHSGYSESAGADRKKGEILQKKILKLYPDHPETLNLISSIAFDRYNYKRAEKYCSLTLQINPDHLEAKRRLDFLNFLNKKPVINKIIIEDKGNLDEKTIQRFIHIKTGDILDVDVIKKTKDDLKEFHSISDVDIYYDKIENNQVNLRLSLSTEVDKIIYVSGGYEFVTNLERMDQHTHYIQGISPVIFFYSHPNFFKKGLVEFNLFTIAGMQWDISMLCNFYEKVQFNSGISTWIVPFVNQFTDYSKNKINKAELIYLNLNPYFEIGKKFNNHKMEVLFTYSPDFIFMMPDDYPLNSVENQEDFIYPDNFFVEHKIGIKFQIDYITLLETGLVRKGFKIKSQIDWIKNTPDSLWGYKDYSKQLSYASFLFYLYLEYSDYIKNLFYFSFGLHYKGGINLYKNQLISISKGIIGVPFDSLMKIHGLNYNKFKAEHVLLFNSIYAFKAHSIFHLGLYFDGCLFFEKYADTYLYKFNSSPYYNNLIFGYGCFFKWIPYKLLLLTLEASFSHEVGQNIIRGPVIGFHIQKSFVDPKIKTKKGREKIE